MFWSSDEVRVCRFGSRSEDLRSCRILAHADGLAKTVWATALVDSRSSGKSRGRRYNGDVTASGMSADDRTSESRFHIALRTTETEVRWFVQNDETMQTEVHAKSCFRSMGRRARHGHVTFTNQTNTRSHHEIIQRSGIRRFRDMYLRSEETGLRMNVVGIHVSRDTYFAETVDPCDGFQRRQTVVGRGAHAGECRSTRFSALTKPELRWTSVQPVGLELMCRSYCVSRYELRRGASHAKPGQT